MAEKPNHLRWNILSDEEVTRRQDDAFGVHTAYAKLLMQVAKDSPTPFSIGLYSSWGTGKTSIIRILQELVSLEQGNELAVIYLDVWKYSSDPLKRWILLETERQLADHKLLVKYEFQNRTLQSHLEFEEELEDKNHLEIDFKNFGLVLGIALLSAIIGFIGWLYIPAGGKLYQAVEVIFALVASGGILAAIATASLKKMGESLAGLVFRRTVKHVSAKPTFSSEKFAQIFRDLVSRVISGAPKRRLLFVFDNLDRCPADVAVDVIGVIKTFLDEPGCVYVVPCDEEAILTHIKANFLLPNQTEASDVQANQFLAKFFQMTLRLPPPADFAVEDYVDKELRETKMEDLNNDSRDVLVLGYHGETPRQVKRVLNDLIAYRGIAEQVEREGLVEPGALTSDLGHLTKMAVLSAKWPSFMRRLADDPVLWTDVMQRIRTQPDSGTEDLAPDLQQFLWNTRLVSPDTDIRPWLYFRRGTLERDASLHRRIQEILQNGAWKQMLDMLSDESLRDKKSDILQIASTTVRRWLTSNRRVLLRNAAPVVLKASLAEPSDTDLARDVLNVLEYLVTNASAEEMEQLFDVKDVLQITKTAPSWQRRNLLTKYSQLFDTKFPTTDGRTEVWKQLIQNHDALDTNDRNEIRTDINSRYSMQPNGEVEILALLQFVTEDLGARQWCVSDTLLATVSTRITFDDTDTDKKRLKTLIALRKLQSKTVLRSILAKIAGLLEPSRTSTADAPARNSISTLVKYEAELLAGNDSKLVVEHLIAQANRSPVADRTWWAIGLFHLYPVLDEVTRSQVAALFTTTFVDADPSLTIKFLSSIHKSWLSHLWRITDFNSVLKTQAASYLARYATNALAHRQQVLAAFGSDDVLHHPEVFDPALSWDLAIYVEMAKKALEEKQVAAEDIGRLVEGFCKDHLPASLSTNKELYASLLQLLTEHSEILTVGLAEIVASCQLAKILAGDHTAYPTFVKFKRGLPIDRQLQLTRELLQSLSSRQGSWIDLLTLLVSDVSSDESLDLRDPQLLDDLSDYTFLGAREEWTKIGDSLTKVVSLLSSNRQQEYIDRALDSLIALEAEGDELSKMEPFVKLVTSQSIHITGALVAKAAKFAQRMLGASKSDMEKSATLKFVSVLGPPLLAMVKQQVEAISNSSDSEIAREARQLLGPRPEADVLIDRLEINDSSD